MNYDIGISRDNNRIILFPGKKINFELTTTLFNNFNKKLESSDDLELQQLKTLYSANRIIFMNPDHSGHIWTTLDELPSNSSFIGLGDGAIVECSKTGFYGLAHCSTRLIADDLIGKIVTRFTECVMPPIKYLDEIEVFIYSGICESCYEIDQPFIEMFDSKLFPRLKGRIRPGKDKTHFQLNLIGLIFDRIIDLGIPAENINLNFLCSKHSSWLNIGGYYLIDSQYPLASRRPRGTEKGNSESNAVVLMLPDGTLLASSTANCPYIAIKEK